MKTVAVGKFKQICLRLIDQMSVSGEPILITKRGEPVAQLVPVPRDQREDWAGSMRNRGSIRGDLVAPAAEPQEWEALRE